MIDEPDAWQWRYRSRDWPGAEWSDWSDWREGRTWEPRSSNVYETQERPLFTASPAALPKEEPTVKPLEWETLPLGSVVARMPYGKYLAYDNGRALLHFDIIPPARVGNDLEAAKAAAQADYEQRIRSALCDPSQTIEILKHDLRRVEARAEAAEARTKELTAALAAERECRMRPTRAALDQHDKNLENWKRARIAAGDE